MRGWMIEIGTDNGTGFSRNNRLLLTSHADWQAVLPGTILTFIEKNTAQGGLDTGIKIRDNSTTTGDLWTNIWIGDPTYLLPPSGPIAGYVVSGGVVSGIDIGNDNTLFQVKNSLGQIVYGPAGEGVAPLSGLNSKEVLKLKAHPTVLVSPTDTATATTRGYDDGGSGSTFGSPNTWTEGTATITQLFNTIPPAEILIEQPVGSEVADGSSLSFGSVTTGKYKSLVFTIRNTGLADLTGLTITKDGNNASDFIITANPLAPVAGPDGVTSFTVRFAPTASGSRKAAIHIASNDEDEASYDIKLTGIGVVNAPEISIQEPVGSELKDGSTKKSFGT
ncbi:MAG: choice-of-anchor D domain-containing protein, partial [Verrucomicrobiaceae bacterium]